jgi:hypothetical protein
VSKKKKPEFVPKVIEDSHGEDFIAFIPQQIESDWDEKWGPLLEGFPLNIVYAGITNNEQASSAVTNPSTEFEPRVEDYYPEDESCIVIIGGIHPPKNSESRKQLPTPASSRTERPSDVCYWPDLATFQQDSKRKEMCYFTQPRNGYFVRVIFKKATGQWRTEKFKGKKLIRSTFASTFEQAMTHTTMGGPEPDER